MRTVKLYRPVGITELGLIMDAGFRAFPPRLSWQPIFYPVLNKAYASQIASEWNTNDPFSGYCGIVTSFELDEELFLKYPVQNAGGPLHNELWVPAGDLEEFNHHIIGAIRVVDVYFGDQFSPPDNEQLSIMLMAFKK